MGLEAQHSKMGGVREELNFVVGLPGYGRGKCWVVCRIGYRHFHPVWTGENREVLLPPKGRTVPHGLNVR